MEQRWISSGLEEQEESAEVVASALHTDDRVVEGFEH